MQRSSWQSSKCSIIVDQATSDRSSQTHGPATSTIAWADGDLAVQVTQNIMKQLAAERGSTTIDQQAGGSSSGPADRGERRLGLPQLSYVPANIKITRAEIRHYLGLNRPHWITLPTLVTTHPCLLCTRHTPRSMQCLPIAIKKKATNTGLVQIAWYAVCTGHTPRSMQ